jgi:hypothetical protein
MNPPISPIIWSPPPAIAIEFATCFSDPVFLAILEQSGLNASSLETLLVGSIQSSFEQGRESLADGDPLMAAIAALFPGPSLRVAVAFLCSKSGREVGGVWLIPFVHSVTQLNSVSILPAGEIFAFQFPAVTLQGFLAAVWGALQKSNRRLDKDGTPDPSGPLEITEPRLYPRRPRRQFSWWSRERITGPNTESMRTSISR